LRAVQQFSPCRIFQPMPALRVPGCRRVMFWPERIGMVSEELLIQCEEILGYRFKDVVLLKESLTHASIADTRKQSNERLQFLGGSVLGLVVCHRLFELYPDYLEGDLTKLKSAVVSRNTCAAVANAIGLTELLFVGKGMTGRSDLPGSLAAGAYESVV